MRSLANEVENPSLLRSLYKCLLMFVGILLYGVATNISNLTINIFLNIAAAIFLFSGIFLAAYPFLKEVASNNVVKYLLGVIAGILLLILYPLAGSSANLVLQTLFHVDGKNFEYTYSLLMAFYLVLLCVTMAAFLSLLSGFIISPWILHFVFPKWDNKFINHKRNHQIEVKNFFYLMTPVFVGIFLSIMLMNFTLWTDKYFLWDINKIYKVTNRLDLSSNYLCKNIPQNQRILFINYGLGNGEVLLIHLDRKNIETSIEKCVMKQ